MTRALPLLLLFAVPLTAAPVPKAVKKADDATLILGRWESVTVQYDGRPGTAGAVFRFADDGKGGVVPPGQKAEVPATFTLDPNDTPKRLEWALNGPAKSVATYELDGDTLKLAFGAATRPPKAAPGPGVSYYELKRVKEDK